MSRENSKEGFLRRPGNNLRPVLGLYKSTRCRGSNQRDRIGPFFIVPLGTRVGEGAWEEGRSPPEVVIAMEETLAEQEDRNLNSDSSSSSSDDDDEAAEDLRIKTLEKSLAKNPFDYDTNVQVIPSLMISLLVNGRVYMLCGGLRHRALIAFVLLCSTFSACGSLDGSSSCGRRGNR
ncbi:hypothetical protein BHE74_00008867 [Ensete ventricosum]|nr:hypothetical protein BHE74_00008867 [Ensete ventricosum]